ncbi:hypothetical protein CMsap09_08510 [Clavibacter michiganensis]|uniref:O-antigen polysaccharide polymerase Wzy n=1 Tax=Clavibacter michiganensis TaxID=28447 RepID=A0A251XTS9_9MICO|nr:hypothetical protein CMsap09_08510 [Clavibacter michiganensis]
MTLALATAAVLRPEFAAVLPAALLNGYVFLLVRYRLAPAFLSPAMILAGYLTLIGLSGYFLVNGLAFAGGTSGIDFAMTDALLARTANLFLLASTLVLAGAWVTRGTARSTVDMASLLDFGDLTRYKGVIILAATLDLVVAISLAGIDRLLMRTTYIFDVSGGFIGTIVSMASLAAIVGLGLVAFGTKGGPRALAVVLIGAFVVYFVALGTRRLGLIPIILLLSYIIANRGRVRIPAVVVALVSSVVGLALTLHFRNLPLHGLLPHLSGLSSFTLGWDEVRENLNNVLVGFRITALTAFEEPSISTEIFRISVSPFSGSSLGWGEVSQQLRLNTYTPYSAVGEVANQGAVVTAVFFAFLGLVFGIIERLNAGLLSSSSTRLYALLVLGLVFLFVVQSIQYNLRSITRFVFFALAVQLAVMAIAVASRRTSRLVPHPAAAPRAKSLR